MDSEELPHCYYCGEVATTVDHVVPQSMIRDLRILDDPAVTEVLMRKNRVLTVPACLDCNVRLGNSYSETLAGRRSILRDRLARKHDNLLSTPDWSEQELDELGPTLRRYVRARLHKREQVRGRLGYDAPLSNRKRGAV